MDSYNDIPSWKLDPPPDFENNIAPGLDRQRQEAERRARENPAPGHTNTSGNNNNSSSSQQQPQQQQQQQDEDHPMEDHPVENTRPGVPFYGAFNFNFNRGRGRGQSQGQSRGQAWRGAQNNGRGQIHSRGRGNAGPGRGDFAVTRFNRGGGPIGASVYSKEMTFAVASPQHLEQAVQSMQKQFPGNIVTIKLRAVPDNLRQIARNRQLQQSTKYTDRKYPLKKGPKPKENPRVEHVGEEEGVRCVLCDSKSHRMGFCLSLVDGELRGCPLCHDPGHAIDQCQTFLAMSLNDKVRTLVDGRTNMPPLATSIPWWDYLHQWLEDDVSKKTGRPFGFPWSVDFARRVIQRNQGAFVKGLQEEFDKDHNKRSILPVDADTNTFKSVYLKYWSSERKSFPVRIREMTGEVAPPNASAAGFFDEMEDVPFQFDIDAEVEDM